MARGDHRVIERRHHQQELESIVTSWNKGAERLFGYKAEEMVGPPIGLDSRRSAGRGAEDS